MSNKRYSDSCLRFFHVKSSGWRVRETERLRVWVCVWVVIIVSGGPTRCKFECWSLVESINRKGLIGYVKVAELESGWKLRWLDLLAKSVETENSEQCGLKPAIERLRSRVREEMLPVHQINPFTWTVFSQWHHCFIMFDFLRNSFTLYRAPPSFWTVN